MLTLAKATVPGSEERVTPSISHVNTLSLFSMLFFPQPKNKLKCGGQSQETIKQKTFIILFNLYYLSLDPGIIRENYLFQSRAKFMILKLQLQPFHLFKRHLKAGVWDLKKEKNLLMPIQLREEKTLYFLPFDTGLSDKKPFHSFLKNNVWASLNMIYILMAIRRVWVPFRTKK